MTRPRAPALNAVNYEVMGEMHRLRSEAEALLREMQAIGTRMKTLDDAMSETAEKAHRWFLAEALDMARRRLGAKAWAYELAFADRAAAGWMRDEMERRTGFRGAGETAAMQ